MRTLIPIRRGQVITARYLGTLAENQNELAQALRAPGGTPGQAQPPGTQTAIPPGQVGNIDPLSLPGTREQDAAGVTQAQPADTYTELSRVTSTVRVENPGDPAQYVDVERIDEVLFSSGAGRLLLLKFNNG